MYFVNCCRNSSTLPLRGNLARELALSERRSRARQNLQILETRISNAQDMIAMQQKNNLSEAYSGLSNRRKLLMYLFMGLVYLSDSSSSFVIPEPLLEEEDDRNCQSDIYCYGDILHTIQMAHIFDDSKHFVDMPLRYSPDIVKHHFEELMNETEQHPDQDQLRMFVANNFDDPGTDTERYEPQDWRNHPAFLDRIHNNDLRNWAEHLHGFWKNLSLKVIDNVKHEPERYSIIHVPNPVIVPGDRFREFYYWDSYWTMKGLLLSEMYDTVRGMLENFLGMVEAFGFVPNGGRIYYTERSQPPFLIPMMYEYVKTTRDYTFLKDNIKILEKEFAFWNIKRSVNVEVNGKVHKLSRYDAEGVGPRPESYYEDVQTASIFQDEADKQSLYKDLKTGAESGWDFSTRWYINKGTNTGDLSDTKARSILPVDLNSILCYNARILANFFDFLGNHEKSEAYRREARLRDEAVNTVLWDEEKGVWLDYDLENEMRRPYFYLSNLNPLWTHCYETVSNQKERLDQVLDYIRQTKILEFQAGVPTSLMKSTQQWDLPNVWPPIVHMLIEGLQSLNREDAKAMAFDTAQNWIRTMYNAYSQSGYMFEKYNAITGEGGGGGEYDVQLGFGWTNGVALDILAQYGDRLTTTTPVPLTTTTTATTVVKVPSEAKIIDIPENSCHMKKPSSLLMLWACLATILGGTGIGIGICLLSLLKSKPFLQDTVVRVKGRRCSLADLISNEKILRRRESFYA